jgi:hypothetical protein
VTTPNPQADGPRIVDAVTLRHFGVIERMSVLEHRVDGYPRPRWTETVRSEVLAGIDQPECLAVLAAGFLGQPYEVPPEDLPAIMRLRIALRAATGDQDDDPTRDLGEAESIHIVEKLNGAFVTDDAIAYDFARRRIGSNRVFDTVDLLREAVAYKELSSSEAQHIADAIRNSGRFLRSAHPRTLTAEYFTPY